MAGTWMTHRYKQYYRYKRHRNTESLLYIVFSWDAWRVQSCIIKNNYDCDDDNDDSDGDDTNEGDGTVIGNIDHDVDDDW